MNLVDVLTGPEKWCKRILEDNEGRHCLMGALLVLHTGRAEDLYKYEKKIGKEIDRLARVISNYVLGNEESITRWNDDPARTWDEVAAVIDEYDRDRMLNP